MSRPQTTNPELRQAAEADLSEIKLLLEQASLPFEDLKAEAMQDFVVVRDEQGMLLGAGGIERFEQDGLLRSVVVHETARGTGLGQKITHAVEDRARNHGVKALYLLTTTAEDLFPRLGYTRFDRNDVPDTLKQSAEFASLCPASAVCMHKPLV